MLEPRPNPEAGKKSVPQKLKSHRSLSIKVEKISEDSLDLILLPSSLVKIHIIGRKVYLR